MPIISQSGGVAAAFQDLGTNQKSKGSGSAPAGVPFWGDYPDSYDTVTIAGIRLPGLCAIKGKGFEMRAKHNKPMGVHGESTVYLANEPAEWTVTVMMTTEAHLRAFEKLVPVFKPPFKPKPKPKVQGDPNFALSFQGIPQVFQNDANGALGLGQFGPTSYGGFIREDPKDTPQPGFTPAAPAAADKSAPGYVAISHPLLALFRITHCRITKVTMPEQLEDKGMWQVQLECREYVLAGKKEAVVGTTTSAANIPGMKNAFADVLNQRSSSSPSATNAGPD